jgi:hypothetical protein
MQRVLVAGRIRRWHGWAKMAEVQIISKTGAYKYEPLNLPILPTIRRARSQNTLKEFTNALN